MKNLGSKIKKEEISMPIYILLKKKGFKNHFVYSPRKALPSLRSRWGVAGGAGAEKG